MFASATERFQCFLTSNSLVGISDCAADKETLVSAYYIPLYVVKSISAVTHVTQLLS